VFFCCLFRSALCRIGVSLSPFLPHWERRNSTVLRIFSECQNQVLGHHEHLIGGRLEAKLAISTALKPEEHDIWAAEIRALQQVTPSRPYKAPDEKNSQRYF